MSGPGLGNMSQQIKDKRNDKQVKKDDSAVAKAAKENEDREARINYTLDMVVHDLVSQGHLQPAKSYLLKTPEMKQHIGRMCDQLSRRKKEEERMNNRTRRFAPKSFSTTLSNKPLNNSSSTASKLPNMTRGFAFMKKGGHDKPVTPTEVADEIKKLSSSRSANVLSGSGHSIYGREQEMTQTSKKIESWVSPRDITDKRPRRQTVSKPDNRINTLKMIKAKKQLAALDDESIQFGVPSQGNNKIAQAYRAKVDMSGFANEEISLDLDDRRLMITAKREKKGSQNTRKVTEIVEIPEGVNLENLKIGRRLDGCLLIEEFVPGVDNS